MARLIILLVLVAVVVTAVTAVAALFSPAKPQVASVDTMPKTFRNIAYALLLLLMLGVVTGWVGA